MNFNSNANLSRGPDAATPDDNTRHVNSDDSSNVFVNSKNTNIGGHIRRDYNQRPTTSVRGHNRQRSIFNFNLGSLNPFGGSTTPTIASSSHARSNSSSNPATSISSSSYVYSSSSGRGSRSRAYGRDDTFPLSSTGIALWVEPTPNSPLGTALQSIISGLKPLFDDGHDFAPHITITTGIILNHDHSSPESSSSAAKAEIDLILDKALSAARSVPNFTITLQSVKTGAFFFKKVYFEISPSNSALASLAQLSREVFVLLPQAIANQPHYHALSEGDRARIDAEVAKRAQSWAQSEFDPHLSLVYSELYPVNEALQRTINQRLEDALGPGFETRGIGWSGGRLSLVRCEGPIHQWQKLGYRDI